MKLRNNEKWGYDWPLSHPDVVKTRKDNLFKKEGIINVFQREEVKEKSKKKKLEYYGDENYNNRNKIDQTNLKEYGNICSLRGEKQQQLTEETNLKLYNNKIYTKSEHHKQKIRNNTINRYLHSDRLKEQVVPLFTEFTNQKDRNLLWKCTTCGNEFKSNIFGKKFPRCKICYPILNGTSHKEIEIANFIEQYILIERNKRFQDEDVKNNNGYKYEIDIFIPSLNLGIEFDGIYSHSEINGNKDSNYHINKTKYFNDLGIQIIHIFENEWIEKKEIVCSILLSKINKNKKIIYARKCTLKEISNKESELFLFDNHIQGNIKSSIRIGLYYNNELVSIMTFSKSRYNKNYEYELNRFCNKIYTSVIGGFNKLLQYFIKNYSTSILSYADLRYSNGNIYYKNNFILSHQTPPNYFYSKDKCSLESRLQYQKHKLKEKLTIYDENLSEWENMQLNKYDRIFDCGNLVFTYKIKNNTEERINEANN